MTIIIAHIYIGSVNMEGALDAMNSGKVDRNWAKEHHNLGLKRWIVKLKALNGQQNNSIKKKRDILLLFLVYSRNVHNKNSICLQ